MKSAKRGDYVTVTAPGDYGKPRPALIVQSDLLALESVAVLLLTSTLTEAPAVRIRITPDAKNGLQKTSDIMVDKIFTLSRSKLGPTIGYASEETMMAVRRSLMVLLGMA